MNRKQIIISTIMVMGMMLSTVGTAAAAPATIGGHVLWSNGTPCTSIDEVWINNSANGQWWNSSTLPDYVVFAANGYYQTIGLEDGGINISLGNVLHFNVSGGSGLETNTTATLTFSGNIANCNITLQSFNPDLIVESITPNCDGYLFGNQSNEICAKITNIGGAAAYASEACFNVTNGSGWYNATVDVSALNAGANETVCITDPTIRNAGDPVTIYVTADCGNNVTEGNELNNVTVWNGNAVNNGYKGKTYSPLGSQSPGSNITTWKEYDLNGTLIYSAGNSYYLSSYYNPDWTEYNITWTADELSVPNAGTTATVKEARLYVMYTWDTGPVMPSSVSMTFNDTPSYTLDEHYWDEIGWGSYPNTPYGMLVYNVTDDLNPNGPNTANLTNSYPGGNNVSMRGMVLMAIYEDNVFQPRQQIFVNEEFDLLCGRSSKCTTPAEATAWAPMSGTSLPYGRLITLAPGAWASESGSANLIFNGEYWYDAWSQIGYMSGSSKPQPQIGLSDIRCVGMSPTSNLVGFESDANYMEASNAFLIASEMACVETATGTGTACFSADKGNISCVTAIHPSTISCISPGAFTHGLFSFNITGLSNGEIVNVTIMLPANAIAGETRYVKVNTTASNCTQYEIPIGDDDGDNVITIQLQDGGVGDHDGAADGQITDPGGPTSGTVQIAIDQPTYVQPQQQFTINITVDPMGNPVSAVQYDLYYNTSVVWAEWANPGAFLHGAWDTEVNVLEIYNEWDVANHIGKISYAETTIGDPLPSVDTKGVITTIHFSAIGVRGTSNEFYFKDALVSDPDKQPVDNTMNNCTVTIYDNIDPVANGTSMHRFSNVASKFQCFAVLCPCLSHAGHDWWKGDNITYIRWDFGDGQYGTSEGISLLNPCNVKEHMYTTWDWFDDPGHVNGGYYRNLTAYLTVRDDGCPPASNTSEVPVMIYIAGDTNGDGVVNIFDLACVGKHWGQSATGPGSTCDYYWADLQQDEADLNNDNDVDTIDAMIVGTNWNHLAYPPYYQE